MSTPSPTPLECELESPYAPKWAREQASTEPSANANAVNEASGTEERDAKILAEVESSLREMLDAANGRASEILRLSEVSRVAAEHLAQEKPDAPEESDRTLAESPSVVAPDATAEAAEHDEDRVATYVDDQYRPFESEQPRVPPPWRSRHTLEPEAVPEPEPWPRPRSRKRNGAKSLFVRFGLATTGAAALAALVVNDVPRQVYQTLSGSFADLSSNAAAAFNAGKAPSMQTKLEEMTREQERAAKPQLHLASVGPAPQEPRPATKSDNKSDNLVKSPPPPEQPAPAAREAAPAVAPAARETVMASSWPTPPAPRPEAIWHGPPSRGQTSERTTTAVAQRTMSSEETAMLRKLGDDYVASGDFAGARVVYERAADAGDASAALALAATYDPVVLARSKVRGLEPDVVKAGFWYERARELGSPEAPRRLQAMAGRNE